MRSRYGVKEKRVHPAAPILGARVVPNFPGFIEPAHPAQRNKTPDGDKWLHEVKVDGYRCQLHLYRGTVKAFTRRAYDWASRFASIADAAKRLPVIEAVIDGEVIATDDDGTPDFNLLQSQLASDRSERLVYVAFDLLYLDGHELRPAALEARKALLQTIVAKLKSARLLYSQHIVGGGPAVHAEACKIGAEGIVSKVRDAPYRSGRTDAWIKTLCRKRDTFVVVAFVPATSVPKAIGALYLGREKGRALVYAGKAGTGYSTNTALDLYKRLAPLVVSKSPLTEPVKKPKAIWVKPEMLVDVEYRAITPDGRLRHASFKGVRDDLMGSLRPVRRR